MRLSDLCFVGFRGCISAIVLVKGCIGCMSIEMFFSKG